MEETHPLDAHTKPKYNATTLRGSTISYNTIPANVLRKTDIALVAELQSMHQIGQNQKYIYFLHTSTDCIN